MPVVTWDEKYSVKIPEIDAQHRRLFDLINAFYEAIMDKQAEEGMKRILHGLIQYTEFHFQFEERLMERCRYPGLDAQRAAHKAFVQKVNGFKTRNAEGKLLLTVEVTNFLKTWLVEHILASDMKYVPFLASRGPLTQP